MSQQELQELSVHELREMCRSANMKVSGRKDQLVMRLCGMEKPRMSKREVNKWLEEQGVVNIKKVSKCLRAGIQERHINIDGDSPLDNVIMAGKCEQCGHAVKATIRDLLYQPDHGVFDYQHGGNGTVKCENEKCFVVDLYVADICSSGMRIDEGKGHNHCTVCPGFGMCIGDYRDRHCMICGDHFFAGSGEQFPCPCQGPYISDEEY